MMNIIHFLTCARNEVATTPAKAAHCGARVTLGHCKLLTASAFNFRSGSQARFVEVFVRV
jgi:hypothetical protein